MPTARLGGVGPRGCIRESGTRCTDFKPLMLLGRASSAHTHPKKTEDAASSHASLLEVRATRGTQRGMGPSPTQPNMAKALRGHHSPERGRESRWGHVPSGCSGRCAGAEVLEIWWTTA